MKAKVFSKEEFMDMVAVELFARGYPEKNVYKEAERLWVLRENYFNRIIRPNPNLPRNA